MTIYTREQVFTSPGTWTRPPTVTWVEVTVVGGGGGSGALVKNYSYSPKTGSGAGGGGAVVRRVVPVSTPIPVTVGAGGIGGVTYFYGPTPPGATIQAPPTVAGATGGTSAFGPLGPGPVPLIPGPTVAAGGGGGGGGGHFPFPPGAPVARSGNLALPIGGGAGGIASPNPSMLIQGGTYGSSNWDRNGGGSGSQIDIPVSSNNTTPGSTPVPGYEPLSFYMVATGRYGFGGGGTAYQWRDNPFGGQDHVLQAIDGGGSAALRKQNPPAGPYTFDPAAPVATARANSGGGAGAITAADPLVIPGPAPTAYTDGVAGASGIVIVRWNE